MKDINELRTYIEQTNKQFEEATPAEKRVMIAEDTIARIQMRNIIPLAGNFLGMKSTFRASDIQQEQFQDFLNNTQETDCQVCAKGALFCSVVGRVNKFTTKAAFSGAGNSFNDPLHRKLLEFFSEEQIDLIEIALEGGSYLNTEPHRNDYSAALQFSYKYMNNDRKCILAICENIVNNKGYFKP